jgi:hypothetical protein
MSSCFEKNMAIQKIIFTVLVAKSARKMFEKRGEFKEGNIKIFKFKMAFKVEFIYKIHYLNLKSHIIVIINLVIFPIEDL